MSDSGAFSAINDKVREVKRVYHGLQAREQNLITALAVVVLIALVYLMLMFPAQNSVAAATKKLEAKQSLLQWMKANEEAAKLISQSNKGNRRRAGNQNLQGTVNSTSSRHGISIQRFEPEGKNKLRVWLEDASFNKLVKWLHQLESINGIAVSSISVDSEKQPGLVSAKIVFKS